MEDLLVGFWKDESAQGKAGYALLVALVALALVAAFTLYGQELRARLMEAVRALEFRG